MPILAMIPVIPEVGLKLRHQDVWALPDACLQQKLSGGSNRRILSPARTPVWLGCGGTLPTAGQPRHSGIPKCVHVFRGSPRGYAGGLMPSIDSRRSGAGRKFLLAASPSDPAPHDFQPFLRLPP